VIDPRLVGHVDWRRINLFDQPAIAELGIFDAILARNVLIYFSQEGIVKVVRALSERLSADGVLLVGISETLFKHDADVRCEEKSGVFFYRKGRL
jgi:chemotaxis protein methyltransferase CheR